MTQTHSIVILGAGATGLGAAYRLTERNLEFTVFEQHDYAGGHAASFTTPEGFTFDEGGHVLFSHYPYFDQAVSSTLGGRVLRHRRESWILMSGSWVRYPFQEHIYQLPAEDAYDCVAGLVDVAGNGHGTPPANFREWIEASFGSGIARRFMVPYNEKVWAHPLHLMDYRWIGERVATVDLKKTVRRLLLREESQWGPNAEFVYPLEGGFGGLMTAFQRAIDPQRLRLGHSVRRIDVEQHVIEFRGGIRARYDSLITTIPLPVLLRVLQGPGTDTLRAEGERLLHNGVFAVGVGVRGTSPSEKHWIYFPESRYPFYRVTFLSNYSPALVPRADTYSLLVETSFSPFRPLERKMVVERIIASLEDLGWLRRSDILSIWSKGMRFGYPIPSLGRDAALRRIQAFLEEHRIYSRGRFGGWRYEVGNTDHSFMQGVEVVDRVVDQQREVTYA